MERVTDEPVVIGRRFNGPPGSGHGGYSAGCAAALVPGPVAEVTLRMPPPLQTPLTVRRDGGSVALLDGDDVVAVARSAELELGGPEPVSLAQAGAASERFAW